METPSPTTVSAEQAEAEQLLADMESDDLSSRSSPKSSLHAGAVFAHAEAEESTVIPLLEQIATPERRQDRVLVTSRPRTGPRRILIPTLLTRRQGTSSRPHCRDLRSSPQCRPSLLKDAPAPLGNPASR